MLTYSKLYAAYKQISTASRHYGVSLPWVVGRAIRLHNRQLFSLKDMLAWGVLDPAIDADQLELYVSREARTRLRAKVNDPGCNDLVRSKARFYEYCKEAGLPIPVTLGVFQPPSELEAFSHREHWLSLLDEHGNRDLISKPVVGERGEGLNVVHGAEGHFRVGQETFSPDGLYDYLLAHSKDEGLVVQVRERAHPDIQRMTGTDALQSARIVTLLHDDGSCRFMFSRFKFIVGEHYVDNFSWGSLGNLTSDVDSDTGVVQIVFTMKPGLIGMSRVTDHPVTGERLVGMTIPFWKETLQTVSHAARLFPRLRTLGWDIGITPEGPVILEANPAWIVSPPGPMKRPVSQAEWRELLRPSVRGHRA